MGGRLAAARIFRPKSSRSGRRARTRTRRGIALGLVSQNESVPTVPTGKKKATDSVLSLLSFHVALLISIVSKYSRLSSLV